MYCRKILLLLLVCCSFAARSNGQEYDTAAAELDDIQRVVEATLPDIETMLSEKGNFRPFAMVILANDSIAEISVPDSVKNTYTEDDLKEELSIGALKGDYRVVVIFYPARTTDPATSKRVTAVALFAEHTNDDIAYQLYYPYTITPRKEVVFGESFGDVVPQVMFNPD